MNIGIDARLYGLNHAGIGRYTQNLIEQIIKLDHTNQYYIFYSGSKPGGDIPSNFKLIHTPIKHYSLSEQINLPRIINLYPLDFIHFPHFNVPLFCPKPFLVTIHDLLWHEKIGLSATTLSPLKYLLKYLGYRATITNAINRSVNIFTPTDHVAHQIKQKFNTDPTKIITTSLAVNQIFFTTPKPINTLKLYGLSKNYIIYTGSLYPHKNVNNLIKAIKFLPHTDLAIISARNIFLQNTKQFAQELGLSSRIKFLGYIPDQELVSLYSKALCLVQPSQSEGFGLTGLEAMATGLPVVCTTHPVLKEVYTNHAIYTDTSNPQKLAHSIKELAANDKIRTSLSTKGRNHASKFSWQQTAKSTLAVYQKVGAKLRH